MALNLEESKKKYANFIQCMHDFMAALEKRGYTVTISDDIELEATYHIELNSSKIAKIHWNVPYYLDFDTYIDQDEKSFSIDYVKNFKDWEKFVKDVEDSLYSYIERERN